MIVTAIVACEIAFWVAIAAGLILRYPGHRPRAGLVVLATVPAIDIALLVAVGLSLRAGAEATTAHMLATFFLGFSLTYGHRTIRWADRHFAHRFASGSAPIRPTGAAYTRACWADAARTAGACALASFLAWSLVTWIGEPERTLALTHTYQWALLITGIDFLWALSYTIWPRREPTRPAEPGRA
ncbi:hypothetical protein VRY54_01205 [Actinomyces sp. F1_1611]